MDPDATWQCLREALQDLDAHPDNAAIRQNAVGILESLLDWLRRDGFPPKIAG
jgi:hypothetical protein